MLVLKGDFACGNQWIRFSLHSIQNYKEYEKRWTQGLVPEWKQYNKEKVFKDWIRGYYQYLEKRGFDVDFSIAMSKLLHIYSLNQHEQHEIQIMNGDYFLEQWDGEDGNEKTKTFTLVNQYKAELKTLRKKIPDALAKMSDFELRKYGEFNKLSAESVNHLLDNSSPNRYKRFLSEKLIENTQIIGDQNIRENWKQLLVEGTSNDRFVEFNAQDHDDVSVLQQQPFGEWIKNFILDSQGVPGALLAQSGYGKTTSIYQASIEIISNKSLDVSPLIIKARDIRNHLKFDGDINLSELVEDKEYCDYWIKKKSKLLIIDGLDEARTDTMHLHENIHKCASFYDTRLLITSRKNLKSVLSRRFETVELRGISPRYTDKLIATSSPDSEARKIVRDFVRTRDEKQPMVIFGIAEILTLGRNSIEESDLSTYGISKWRFEKLVAERKRKRRHTWDQAERLAAALGDFIISRALNRPLNSVFEREMEVIRDWHIVDEHGLLDDDHEGYCLANYLLDSIGENGQNQIKKEELMAVLAAISNQDDRWAEIALCLMGSSNPTIKLADIYAQIEEYSDDKVVLLLNKAHEEWYKGTLPRKQNILKFLGFNNQNIDAQGRLSIGFNDIKLMLEQKERPTDDDARFLFDVYLVETLNFHCGTWQHEADAWSNLPNDETWEALTNCLFLTYYSQAGDNTNSRGVIDSYDRKIRELLNVMNERELREPENAPPAERLIQYVEGLLGTHWPAKSIDNSYEIYARLEEIIFSTIAYDFDMVLQLVPMMESKKSKQVVLNIIPTPMKRFLVNRLNEFQTHDYPPDQILQTYQWLLLMNHLQSKNDGFHRMRIFSVGFDRELWFAFKSLAEEIKNEHEALAILERIYLMIRNHHITDESTEKKW